MKRGFQLALVVVGVILLAPAAWYWAWIWISDPVQPRDLRVAFERLAAVPLKRIDNDRSMDLTVVTPNDVIWSRIRRNWGDPGYIITAASPGPKHYMYCLKDLGLSVRAMIGSELLKLEIAEYPPYGYSSNCKPAGLLFRAPPGATVRIHVGAQDRFSADADLIIEPYWTMGTKDHLVGISLEEDLHLRAVAIALAVAGIIAISLAVLLFSRGRARLAP
jgi:hypothetical protein